MTPRRASASGVHYSDSCAGEGDPCMGDSNPFWGYGTEGENASVSTSRWGGVAVIQPSTLESPSSPYSPGHDSTSLPSPTFLFSKLPSSGAWAASPSADIDQLSVMEAAPLPGLPQRLTRKWSREVERAAALPVAKKPADRIVQIAGFTWALPPDPGKDGPYPSLTFLSGAAISSSKSGMMTLPGIYQWIRARYPSMPQLTNSTIRCALARPTDFTHIQTGLWDKGVWRLRNPQQFRGYYEEDIFLTQRCGIGSRDRALGSPLPSSEQDSPTEASTALSVKIGGHIFTLPRYRAGRKKPPLRLLCGCAIALGSEQGSSVKEIATWISGYYPAQVANATARLKANIRSTLATYSDDFRRSGNYAPRISKKRPFNVRWILKKPADFVVRLSPMQSRRRVGTVASPVGVRQVLVSSGRGAESAPELARKRPDKVERAVVPPCAKEPVDRTVHIAGFTWTLPPDPGEGGPYPSLIFLAGAAISSSDSGIMTLAEIRQWIGERYPSRLISTYNSISGTLFRRTDFISIRAGKQNRRNVWKLRDPEEFRSYYEKDIYLKHRRGVAYRDWAHRSVPPAPVQKSSGAVSSQPGLSLSDQSMPPRTGDDAHLAPKLSVKIGGHILTLPAYSVGQRKPSLGLLCGCAIALGPEQGSGLGEITEWIAGRYFVRSKSNKKKLNDAISRILSAFHRDFRRTKIYAPREKGRRGGMRWVLINPAGFAASYGGRVCSQDWCAPSPEKASRPFKEGAEL